MVTYDELRARRFASVNPGKNVAPRLPGLARGFQPIFDELWVRLSKTEEREAEILASLDMLHEKVTALMRVQDISEDRPDANAPEDPPA